MHGSRTVSSERGGKEKLSVEDLGRPGHGTPLLFYAWLLTQSDILCRPARFFTLVQVPGDVRDPYTQQQTNRPGPGKCLSNRSLFWIPVDRRASYALTCEEANCQRGRGLDWASTDTTAWLRGIGDLGGGFIGLSSESLLEPKQNGNVLRDHCVSDAVCWLVHLSAGTTSLSEMNSPLIAKCSGAKHLWMTRKVANLTVARLLA
jgi:hypothetical protein